MYIEHDYHVMCLMICFVVMGFWLINIYCDWRWWKLDLLILNVTCMLICLFVYNLNVFTNVARYYKVHCIFSCMPFLCVTCIPRLLMLHFAWKMWIKIIIKHLRALKMVQYHIVNFNRELLHNIYIYTEASQISMYHMLLYF